MNIFFGQRKDQPLDSTNVVRKVIAAAKKARINKEVKLHTLRHCYATHALEAGVPLRTIQKEMGHSSLKTTLGYFQYIREHWQEYKSPFDLLITEYSEKIKNAKNKKEQS